MTIELQNLQLLLIGLAAAVVAFLIWLFRSYWPKQMEKKAAAEEQARSQALEKASNEIKHQQALFQEELETRRQERLLEREQRDREAAMNNQILQGFLEGAQNSVKLSERYLDHAEKTLNEISGHRAVLTDVSDTIGKIHADFEGLKTKMAEIAQGVQTSTTASNTSATALNQVMQIVQAFGKKLDDYTQAAKGDTGTAKPVPVMTPPAEVQPQ